MRRTDLEQVLLEMQAVDSSSLERAREISVERGVPLRETLVSAGMVGDHDMAIALGRQWDLPVLQTIGDLEVDPAVLDKLPVSYLRKYSMVPVKQQGDVMIVAVHDPVEQ